MADTTITVVDNIVSASQAGRRKRPVTVQADEIGTIDATGAYTPVLRGDGTGTAARRTVRTVRLTTVKGQWRIDRPPPGLL